MVFGSRILLVLGNVFLCFGSWDFAELAVFVGDSCGLLWKIASTWF